MTRFSEALLADLARSGLTAEDAERLHLEDLSAAASKALGFRSRVAYKIPYFNTKHEVLPEFFRVRFLDEGDQRYSQPTGTAPRLYLPPYVDWTPYLAGFQGPVKHPLILTEGEKKSATASKVGAPTVGLGGVWAWMSHKKLLPDFAMFDWKDREVYLIFDSDVMVKQQVRAALHCLARELGGLGAKPFTVILKNGPNGEKTGIDDLIVREGAPALFDAVIKDRETFTEVTELWKLNQDYAVILSPPSVFKLPLPRDPNAVVNGKSMKPKHELINRDHFVKLVEGNRRMVWKDAAGKETIVYAGDKWIQWSFRRQYAYLDYLPGEPTELSDGGFNLWTDFTAESIEGDISPWVTLLDHVFEEDPEARVWFENWVAYPIKHPGTKMYSAAIIWGREGGCGKTLVGYVLGDLYGDNYAEIDQTQLHGNFNEWTKHKQFILAEEIANSDKRADANRLKAMITRDKVTINAKFQPEYTITDTVNYLFTSNEPDAMFFVKQDRRYFAHRVEKKLPPAIGGAIRSWSRSKAGAGALRWWAEHKDTGNFNPRAAAPMTKAKADMIEASWTDLDRWANKLSHNSELALGGGAAGFESHDLWTTEELAIACGFDRTPSTKALTNALARAGIHQTERMGTELGGVKLWVVSNAEYWTGKSAAEIAAGYKSKTKASKF